MSGAGGKPLSQNAIGRALGLSSAAMVKLKKQGCPMTSVEAAQAWRSAQQNVAQSKPVPHALLAALGMGDGDVPVVPVTPAAEPRPGADRADYGRVGGDDFRELIRAHEVFADGYEPSEDHKAARTRREIAEANLAEMREAEERGDLIRVAAVKAKLAAVFSTTRDALLQIPARLAPLLAADADPANVQNTLHAEIHLALTDLAGASDRVSETQGELD